MLAERVEEATRPLARLRGLLGRDGLEPLAALRIAPCSSIHTFFMRFPIDAVFLDRKLRVVRALHTLRPFRATRPYLTAAQVVELPAGTLRATGTREGDQLALQA